MSTGRFVKGIEFLETWHKMLMIFQHIFAGVISEDVL